ncbi:MAG: antirestriction protein ArdA [Sphingomonadales bacterium]|nr:MAG: antirestriction protein ArdA [Sphingomonadales bacterium]
MIKLFAQPYDISASGFYFESADEYAAKAATNRNDWGGIVEEYEIQFIDGEGLDAELFRALNVHQGSFAAFLDAAEDWSDDDKIRVIIATGEAGYQFDLGTDSPDRFDIDLYECDSMRDLAMQFVDDGLFGEIPDQLQHYLDYDAIARDLAMDYSQAVIDDRRYLYRC